MSVQGSINQLLALTTGGVALLGKPTSQEALTNAIEKRDLAKSEYEKTESDVEKLNKNFSEEEIENIEKREGLHENLTPERELELKHKYSNKGIIGQRKLAKAYQRDRDAYEYNQAVTQKYRNDILKQVEENKQIKRDAAARAREFKKQKQDQMKDLKKEEVNKK